MKTSKDILAPIEKLAGERELNHSNDTTITRYFNAVGSAYCGFTIWYADRVTNSGVLTGCANPAYCPTLRSFLENKRWKRYNNAQAQPGDIFILRQYNSTTKTWDDMHTGFIYKQVSGSTYVTLEGNTTVYSTVKEAEASQVNTGSFEGIGYKKRYMPNGESYYIFHPPYLDSKTYKPRTCNTILPELMFDENVYKPEVKGLQTLLNANHYECGKADGYFGIKTKAAVLSIQQKNGLEEDSIVGAMTWPHIIKLM